jgi:hypothetical protein
VPLAPLFPLGVALFVYGLFALILLPRLSFCTDDGSPFLEICSQKPMKTLCSLCVIIGPTLVLCSLTGGGYEELLLKLELYHA